MSNPCAVRPAHPSELQPPEPTVRQQYARNVGGAQQLTRRRVLTIAAGTAGAGLLWPVLAVVFSSDRGIGFRDEGLYLLAADPPSPTARWVTPFGWHTAPFFDLVGHDIARLRTLALWVLALTGALFGWAVARAVAAHHERDTDHTPATRLGTATTAAFVVTGALGALLLTSGLLRTPGYNWVNLVGLMVASTGVLVADSTTHSRPWRSRHAHAAAATAALGIVFTVPAKPSSAPLFVVAAAAYLAVRLRRRAVTFAAMTATWGAAWTALAVATGIWPTSFLTVLARSATFPPLDRNQTIPGAFLDVLRQPKVAWHDLSLLRPATIGVMVVAAVAAWAMGRHRTPPGWMRRVPFALAALAAVGTAVPWPLLGHPNPAVRFDWYGTTNAGVLLFVGALLHVIAHRATNDSRRVRSALGIAGLLVSVVFIFGFGSAMSIYHQAALAAAVMWCAAAAMAASAGDRRAGAVGAGIVLLAACALAVSNVVDSRHHPFDSTDVADQTTPTPLGSGTLLLDRSTAEFVTSLQHTAAAVGFCDGDPLIGIVWDWTSTTAVALRARVPEHLILTIYGYPRQADVLDVTVHDLEGPTWRDAWVLTTDPATTTAERAAVLRSALDRLPAAIGRTFPADYALAGDVDGTQLWRPADASPEPCS